MSGLSTPSQTLKIALLTLGLKVEWEMAIAETVRDLEGSSGIRARVVARQEAAGSADLALVAYAAIRHGEPEIAELLKLAFSPTAPSWGKVCIAACDWAEKSVSDADVEGLISGIASSFTGSFVHVDVFQQRLSEWIRATAVMASVSGGLGVATWDDGPADTDPISERGGEPWNPGWN